MKYEEEEQKFHGCPCSLNWSVKCCVLTQRFREEARLVRVVEKYYEKKNYSLFYVVGYF